MGFSTRFCVNLLSLCAVLALAGACAKQPSNHGFTIRNVSVRQEPRQLNVTFAQDLRLSGVAINALQHGVPLTFSVNMELRDMETMTLLADEAKLYKISYLPLSQHYELRSADGNFSRTYPRLRHATNALSRLNLHFESGALAPGGYEFRVRTRLEQSSLPAPAGRRPGV